MGRFYIFSNQYYPNTATTNHELSIVKGLSENGVKAVWIFVIPSDSFDKVDFRLPGIEIRYLWNEKISGNKIVRHIYKWLPLFLFFLNLKKSDIVLCLNAMEYLGLFLRKRGIRVYHERTEHPDVIRTGHFGWTNKAYKRWVTQVDGLFVISQNLKKYFIGIGCKKEAVHVVNMVVDSDRFNGLEKQKTKDKYIAYCGNASNSKDGVDKLIMAFKYVVEKFPQEKLYIIGRKPPEESENKKLVESLGLSKQVVFTGIVSSKEIPQILKNADVLALCRPASLQNEMGFPTKLGEYLLTGNPVVVTKVGDIPRFLKDKESALMVDTSNIMGFGDKMIWALANKDKAEELGLKGKKVAEENFNYLIESRKIINVIFPN